MHALGYVTKGRAASQADCSSEVCNKGCVTSQRVLLQRSATRSVTNVRRGSVTDPSKNSRPGVNVGMRCGGGIAGVNWAGNCAGSKIAMWERALHAEAQHVTCHLPMFFVTRHCLQNALYRSRKESLWRARKSCSQILPRDRSDREIVSRDPAKILPKRYGRGRKNSTGDLAWSLETSDRLTPLHGCVDCNTLR